MGIEKVKAYTFTALTGVLSTYHYRSMEDSRILLSKLWSSCFSGIIYFFMEHQDINQDEFNIMN